MRIDLISLFPEMLAGFLGCSMMKRATESGCVDFRLIPLRDFAEDRHRTTDDRPFGGGPGMVMKPEPLFRAVESVRTASSRVILMCPQGTPFRQQTAQRLAKESHLIFLCGHYEGVDERVRTALVDEEISIGDYVLTNGILPAAVVADAVVRLLPGVLGAENAIDQESFCEPLLEHPQYTRPVDFRGLRVPDALLSGHHGEIAAWRREQAARRTRIRRPDLLASSGHTVDRTHSEPASPSIHLILASASPRRADLLREAGIAFTIELPPGEEPPPDGNDPALHVEKSALFKAQGVDCPPGAVVLGADTVVFCDGHILGKPSDRDEAAAMLRQLSGRRHEVLTGICLRSREKTELFHVRTEVWFRSLPSVLIDAYLDSGEPFDKAGAYAIQGGAASMISRIHGSHTNVIGLPVCEVVAALERFV